MARAKRTPGEVLRSATPGRFQVQVHYYDRVPRAFRPVPAHAVTFDVTSGAEVRQLFARLKALVEGGEWRSGEHPGGSSRGVAAGGVRPVAAKTPVDGE
jgi:hypothetical protein